MRYTLDTNIISEYLKGNKTIKEELSKLFLSGEKIYISGVVYYEIKRGLLHIDAKKQLSTFNELCKSFELLLLDNLIIFDKASEIYADLKGRGLLVGDEQTGDNDIYIASLTIIRNLTLVTNNTKHFERIPNIEIKNWLEKSN